MLLEYFYQINNTNIKYETHFSKKNKIKDFTTTKEIT